MRLTFTATMKSSASGTLNSTPVDEAKIAAARS